MPAVVLLHRVCTKITRIPPPVLCFIPLVYFTEHASNYSDDLDTDDLASFLNNWEDASSDAGLRSPVQSDPNEKLNPIVDLLASVSSEPKLEALPPGPPPMDLEADVTVGEELGSLKEDFWYRLFELISLDRPPAVIKKKQKKTLDP